MAARGARGPICRPRAGGAAVPRRARRPRPRRWRRSRPGRAARAGARRRRRRPRRRRRHQFQRRQRLGLGLDLRHRHQPRLRRARPAPPATAARRASSPASGSDMQRDYALAFGAPPRPTSKPPRTSAAAPASAPRRGSTRCGSRPGKMPILFDPRVATTLLGHFVARDQRRRRSRASRASCSTRWARRSSRTGVTIHDDPLRQRGLRSRAFDGEGLAGRGASDLVADGVLTTWLADSASARQLGIAPTGHAVRGVSGAPGAGPSNLVIAAGHAQPRGDDRRDQQRHPGHRTDRAGGQRRHRRLFARRGGLPDRRTARSARRWPKSPSPRTSRRCSPRSSRQATSASAAASTARRCWCRR